MPYLTIAGQLTDDNQLQLSPSYIVDDHAHAVDDPDGSVRVEFLGRGNRPLGAYGLLVLTPCESEHTRLVMGKVPFPELATAIRYRTGDTVLGQISLRRAAPTATFEAPIRSPAVGRQELGWQTKGAVEVSVLFTHDRGETWLPLAVGLTESHLVVDFDVLPGGSACRVALLATDGVRTARIDSNEFSGPVKRCVAIILDHDVRILRGHGWYREERRPELELLSWTSSLDGPLGTGPALPVDLTPGEHLITLSAGTGERQGESSVTLIRHP